MDDAQVRVTRFEFAPGAETGWHVHEMDYVFTALTDCERLLEHPDGTRSAAQIAAGDVYRRHAGTRHNVINAGAAPMSFVELELK